MGRTRLNMFAVCVGIALILAGCTAAPPAANGREPTTRTEPTEESPSEATEFGGINEFALEYEQAVGDLSGTLPPGATLPSQVGEGWDPEGKYEAGAGEMHAALAWQCAWLTEYIDATSDAETNRAHTALERLRSWINLPQVESHVDEQSREIWLNDVVAPAEAGDDSTLKEFAEPCA